MNLNQYKESNDDELLSLTITWLRLPLMIAVVFIHMNPNVDMQMIDYSSPKWIDLYNLIGSSGSHVVSHIAVPCFFMFSGFLYFYKLKDWNSAVYFTKTKKRIRTLLIPYILWNLIPIVVYTIFNFLKFDGSVLNYLMSIKDVGIFKVFWNFNEWGSDRTNLLGWSIPNFGPYNLPLWFLRDLIVVVVLSPLVYHFIKYTRFYGLVLLGIAYYTKVWFLIPGFSITCLFFFSIGAYFSINRKNFLSEFRKTKLFWLASMMISLVLTTYFDNTELKYLFYPIFTISGVVSAIIIVSELLNAKKLKINLRLSKTSFFIYVTHTILILDYSKGLMNYIFPSQSGFIAIIKYLGAPTITVVCCILMYYFFQKITPKLLNILLGTR